MLLFFAIQVVAQVDKVKFDKLQQKILNTENELLIFNFWATWCGPCIEEIPIFEEIDKKRNVKVYLVSVDFQNQYERVVSFVEKRGITSEVLFLDEKDPDSYMTKISKEWTGAIPATLFVSEFGRSYFHERSLTKKELEDLVNKYLN